MAFVFNGTARPLTSIPIDAAGQKITTLAAPTAATDAVNKSYADSLVGGGGGWTDSGTIVHVTTPTDTVAIGAAAMVGAEKLRIVGDTRVEGKLTVTGSLDPTDVILSGGGTAHFMQYGNGTTAAVATAGTGRLVYNDTLKVFRFSADGAAYATIGGGGSDIYAATRVVSLTVGEGTDLTIAAAVAALPAIGGTIFIKQGVYPITVPIVIPAGMSIVFQGAGSDFNSSDDVNNSPTLLDISSGAAGIALFSQAGSSFSTCYFRDFGVRGDDATAQKFIQLTGALAGMQIECRNLAIYRVKDIVNVDGDIEAYFYSCNLQPALLADSSFFRQLGNGGELSWDGVDATIGMATSEAIISAGTNVDWCVTDSYIGGPSSSTFTVNLIMWSNFRIDAANITADANARIGQCELINVSIDCVGVGITDSIISDTIFNTGSPAGYNLRFVGPNNTVSGCSFEGGTTTAISVLATAVNTSVTGNMFTGYTEGILTAATGTVASGNSGLIVTESGAANSNRYTGNTGFSTSVIIGADSVVEGVRRKDITGGATVDALTAVFTHANAKGLGGGGGTIKNMGGSNSLTVRRTATDAFGTTDFLEDVVLPGASLTWPMTAPVSTALSPFVSFMVSVKSTSAGLPTTYDLRHASVGAY